MTVTELRLSFAELRTWSGEETGGDAWKWAWTLLDLVHQQEALEQARLAQHFLSLGCVGTCKLALSRSQRLHTLPFLFLEKIFGEKYQQKNLSKQGLLSLSHGHVCGVHWSRVIQGLW